MENAILIVAAIVFILALLRFSRRVGQELRRQRTLTWPRAVTVLGEGADELPVATADHFGDPIFYEARLATPYTFYARGQKFTGDRLAPELSRLNPSEAKMFLKALEQSRKYYVVFDPHEPEKNYLTVGNRLLGNPHLLLYAIYGIGLPLFLYTMSSRLGGFAGHGPLIAIAVTALLLLLGAAYYMVKPLFNLGLLLLPAPGYAAESVDPDTSDELLESLRNRPVAPATPPPPREKLPTRRR